VFIAESIAYSWTANLLIGLSRIENRNVICPLGCLQSVMSHVYSQSRRC